MKNQLTFFSLHHHPYTMHHNNSITHVPPKKPNIIEAKIIVTSLSLITYKKQSTHTPKKGTIKRQLKFSSPSPLIAKSLSFFHFQQLSNFQLHPTKPSSTTLISKFTSLFCFPFHLSNHVSGVPSLQQVDKFLKSKLSQFSIITLPNPTLDM
jgi:hypothetical protein